MCSYERNIKFVSKFSSGQQVHSSYLWSYEYNNYCLKFSAVVNQSRYLFTIWTSMTFLARIYEIYQVTHDSSSIMEIMSPHTQLILYYSLTPAWFMLKNFCYNGILVELLLCFLCEDIPLLRTHTGDRSDWSKLLNTLARQMHLNLALARGRLLAASLLPKITSSSGVQDNVYSRSIKSHKREHDVH